MDKEDIRRTIAEYRSQYGMYPSKMRYIVRAIMVGYVDALVGFNIITQQESQEIMKGYEDPMYDKPDIVEMVRKYRNRLKLGDVSNIDCFVNGYITGLVEIEIIGNEEMRKLYNQFIVNQDGD